MDLMRRLALLISVTSGVSFTFDELNKIEGWHKMLGIAPTTSNILALIREKRPENVDKPYLVGGGDGGVFVEYQLPAGGTVAVGDWGLMLHEVSLTETDGQHLAIGWIAGQPARQHFRHGGQMYATTNRAILQAVAALVCLGLTDDEIGKLAEEWDARLNFEAVHAEIQNRWPGEYAATGGKVDTFYRAACLRDEPVGEPRPAAEYYCSLGSVAESAAAWMGEETMLPLLFAPAGIGAAE